MHLGVLGLMTMQLMICIVTVIVIITNRHISIIMYSYAVHKMHKQDY